MAYIRTVETKSGARAVQIVWRYRQGSREIEHLGSAHTDAEWELLMAAARQRLTQGQDVLPFDVPVMHSPMSLVVTGTRMGWLLDSISAGYQALGFHKAAGGDQVFEHLVTARIIEPTSKVDAARVLGEAGIRAMSYRTVQRRLPVYATREWRDRISGACTARADLGPSALVLYDVTTLWFDTDTGDGFREPGYSKERRLEPQITVGLLTDQTGRPLMIDAFEGNRGETKTIIPVVTRFVNTYGIAGVTVVADAGMLSATNLEEIENQPGWTFIVAGRMAEIPPPIGEWLATHPGQEPANNLILTNQVVMGGPGHHRVRTVVYQYRADRARRSLHGIDEQVRKAEKQVTGKASVKRNRFVSITGGTKTVNRDLETKARALAGWKSYITNIANPDPATVISQYHQLWRIEHSFRMSKHDLRARPIYHHLKDSINAHLTIVFTALAVSHWIEEHTRWSIKRFVKTLRRYRTVTINTGTNTLIAEDPLPDEIRTLLSYLPTH